MDTVRIYDALCDAAQLLDAIKPDAVREGWWSEHDDNVRKKLTDAMKELEASG